MYTSTKQIEIDEIETDVIIDYTFQFGEIEIDKITDVQTGDAIAPDLLTEMTSFKRDNLYQELHEEAANIVAEKENYFYDLEY